MNPTAQSTAEPTARGTAVRLIGDLGGTHARFATLGSGGGLERVQVLACADHPRLEDALSTYMAGFGIETLGEVCLAVAGPVDQDLVDLPNNHWSFSRRRLEETLGAPLTVINDFTAQALSVDVLGPEQLTWFGTPRPEACGIRGVVGPGTGLGVAIQMPSGEILPSEGGHVGFAPTDEHQMALLRTLQTRFRRVSVERILSGPGLENLYWANRNLAHGTAPRQEAEGAGHRTAREVRLLAEEGDPVALRSVEDFFDILATFTGDLALMAWATGGIFLSGGVLARLMPLFDPERFRARFEDKGRFTRFCETVSIAWIRAEHPGLLGCSAALATPGLHVPRCRGGEAGGCGGGRRRQGPGGAPSVSPSSPPPSPEWRRGPPRRSPPRRRPLPRGPGARPATRSSSVPSRTATATASATSGASRVGWTT